MKGGVLIALVFFALFPLQAQGSNLVITTKMTPLYSDYDFKPILTLPQGCLGRKLKEGGRGWYVSFGGYLKGWCPQDALKVLPWAEVGTYLPVPYVHQVHDTYRPEWGSFTGRWACMATCAVMLLGYLGKLPLEGYPQELGFYVGHRYLSFDTCTLDAYGRPAEGAYGYIHRGAAIRRMIFRDEEGCKRAKGEIEAMASRSQGWMVKVSPCQGDDRGHWVLELHTRKKDGGGCDALDKKLYGYSGYALGVWSYLKRYLEMHGVRGVCWYERRGKRWWPHGEGRDKGALSEGEVRHLLQEALRGGSPVIASVGRIWCEGNQCISHVILIKGYLKDGESFICSDPRYHKCSQGVCFWAGRIGESVIYRWREMKIRHFLLFRK